MTLDAAHALLAPLATVEPDRGDLRPHLRDDRTPVDVANEYLHERGLLFVAGHDVDGWGTYERLLESYCEHSAGHLEDAERAVDPHGSWPEGDPVDLRLDVDGYRFATTLLTHDARHATPVRAFAANALATVSDGQWTYVMVASTRGIYLVYCVRTPDADVVRDRLGFAD